MSRVTIALLLILTGTPPLAVAAGAADPPPPPSIEARAYILMDGKTGQILAENNADERLEPASLTKIMTAYLTFQELAGHTLELDDMVTISPEAAKAEGSRMFAEVGTAVAVENLLKGMIIQSGNDASIALAERIAGSENSFAQRMNQTAESLGMRNTHYVNSMGLPNPDHYTSARDMALLTRALIDSYPDYYRWHAIKEFSFNNIKQLNRNRLLWTDPSVDGVKTGHTAGAGYCLVASAVRDQMRLISVVMGAKSDQARATTNAELLAYGFRWYESKTLYKAGTPLAEARIWKGAESRVAAGLIKDFVVTYPRGQYETLKASLEVDNQKVAPIQAGEELGVVRATRGDQVVAEQALVALNPIERGNVFKRLFDELAMMIQR